MRDGLYSGAIPWLQLQSTPRSGQRFFVAILQFQQKGALDTRPWLIGTDFLSAAQIALAGVEVAEAAQNRSLKGQPIRADPDRRVRRKLTDAAQETPSRQWAPAIQ